MQKRRNLVDICELADYNKIAYSQIKEIIMDEGSQTCINVEFLENYLKENNLSKTAFCKKCKISTRTFDKIIANKTNFNLMAIFRIAYALKIDFRVLFRNEL